MQYWKTFVVMCLIVWFGTLCTATIILLGIFNVLKMNPGLWFLVGICMFALTTFAIVCWFMMIEELKERREIYDNRNNA